MPRTHICSRCRVGFVSGTQFLKKLCGIFWIKFLLIHSRKKMWWWTPRFLFKKSWRLDNLNTYTFYFPSVLISRKYYVTVFFSFMLSQSNNFIHCFISFNRVKIHSVLRTHALLGKWIGEIHVWKLVIHNWTA